MMFSRHTNRISLQHIFLLLLLLCAFLQPAHTTTHSFENSVNHLADAVLHINDLSSSKTDHLSEHDNELCGKCQFGFMGDAVQTATAFQEHAPEQTFLRSPDTYFIREKAITHRSRGPPVS